MRLIRLSVVALLFTLLLPNEPALAAFAAPRFSHVIGRPGHAGVYAWGAATAADGTIIIGDYWNYKIRRFDATGKLIGTYASKGKGPNQNLAPHGVAVSPVDGTIYVSDLNHGEIDVYNADGTYRSSFLNRDPSGRGFYTPRIAVNSLGDIFLPDAHPYFAFNKVVVFDSTGTYKSKFGTTGTGPGQFQLMAGIDIGPNDDVYVADSKRHKIVVFDKDGVFLREFGEAGEGPGLFSSDMRGIRVDDANGWLYAVDADSSEIEKFDLDGNPLLTWGTQGEGPGQFGDGGRELTLMADGTVIAPDFSNNRVNVYSPEGEFLFDFPNPPIPAPNGGFNQPQDVAADPTSNAVYVIDTFNHRVQQFTRSGAFVRKWGFRGTNDPNAMNYPRGIAIDQTTHDVWVANTRDGEIIAYTPTGGFIRRFGKEGYGPPGDFIYHRGLWVGKDGRVTVADSGNARLQVLTKPGEVIYTTPCGKFTLALFTGCSGVTQDALGNIYGAAVSENKIYKYDKDGTLITTWGDDWLVSPHDVAFDRGRLYVTEMEGNRISVYSTTGAFIGSFGSKGAGKGQFNQPRGISVDNAGNLYVVDGLNERIVVFKIPA